MLDDYEILKERLVEKDFTISLFTPALLESFWYEVGELGKTKKVTERDCQRVLSFCLRNFHPGFFTKMVSDIPTANASLGYDITVVSQYKKAYLECKMFNNGRFKIEMSQLAFSKEVKGFDFIEYRMIIFEIEKKLINVYDFKDNSGKALPLRKAEYIKMTFKIGEK